jgi:plastocyanin domain-containing protein
MSTKIIVTLAGLFLIALVNWYFFGGRRKKSPGLSASGNHSKKKD